MVSILFGILTVMEQSDIPELNYGNLLHLLSSKLNYN